MKKKTKLIISSFAVLIVAAAVIGTVAYFSKSFTSDNNVATAAKFNVDVVNADGQTIGDGQFDLGEDLYPGMDPKEVYGFQIKKQDTELPVEYSVNLTKSGSLFPDGQDSPVVLTLQQNDDNNWVDVADVSGIRLNNDVDSFRVLVSWPHGDNDIDFQGATGNVRLDVVATQVDEDAGNSAEEARAMLDEAETALNELDLVGNPAAFTKGNFSKAQSDAVKTLIDDAVAYINGVSNGKAELLAEADRLQQALDQKVASRYVYYEVVREHTNFTQLELKLSADYFAVNGQRDFPKTLKVSGIYRNNEKHFNMEYFSHSQAEVGDQFNMGVRFNNNVRTIDATITNLGGGNWQIDSDWLVENK